MADQIVVGMYESRGEADEARRRLIAEGVRDDRISIEGDAAASASPMPPQDRFAMREVGAPLPQDRGVSAFIARMFSGALMDEVNIGKYTEALRNGRCLLAVRVESDEKRQLAATILERGGPRVYSLPNAPSAWNEASANDPASIGGVDDDPTRPEGLLSDAEGLPVQSDETRLSSIRRSERGNR
jgi:hypothetical protein